MERRYSGWSEWELMEKVGEGAFGKVYRARRVEGSREFYSAIKIITIPGSDAEINELGMEGMSESSIYTYFQGVVDECINEIEMMERLKGNSNIVVVEDFKVVEHPDAMGWDIHIRMELLESFVKYIGGRDLTEEEVVRLGIDICSGLVLCEQQNIIHRDIKPENIFVSTAANFKLGDFGIARKLERTKGAMSHKGTYSYMAPEVFYGKIYDRSIDTYSLGLVLYRLLNKNRGPFLRTDSEFVTYQDKEEALRRRMEGERLPMPCQASPALAQVILRACSYSPEHRYVSAAQMREDLRRIQQGLGDTVVQPVSVQGPRDWEMEKRQTRQEERGTKKKGIPMALLAAAGAVAVIMAGFLCAKIFLSEGSSKTQEGETSVEVQQDKGEVRQDEIQATPLATPTEAPQPAVTTAEPEQIAQPTQQPAIASSSYETYYVVNCKESITLRTRPSTSAGEICQIPLGAAVSYVETAENGFYQIIYNGNLGYGLASYLSSTPAGESPDYETYYVVNCKESITLRTRPSTSAGEICQIPLGAAVSYVGAAGNGFYQIIYDGNTGYGLASYLSPEEGRATSHGVSYFRVVNCKESITLRVSPSTSAEEICQIPLGTTVEYIAGAENGFYQVRYGGNEGYALASYLEET